MFNRKTLGYFAHCAETTINITVKLFRVHSMSEFSILAQRRKKKTAKPIEHYRIWNFLFFVHLLGWMRWWAEQSRLLLNVIFVLSSLCGCVQHPEGLDIERFLILLIDSESFSDSESLEILLFLWTFPFDRNNFRVLLVYFSISNKMKYV